MTKENVNVNADGVKIGDIFYTLINKVRTTQHVVVAQETIRFYQVLDVTKHYAYIIEICSIGTNETKNKTETYMCCYEKRIPERNHYVPDFKITRTKTNRSFGVRDDKIYLTNCDGLKGYIYKGESTISTIIKYMASFK